MSLNVSAQYPRAKVWAIYTCICENPEKIVRNIIKKCKKFLRHLRSQTKVLHFDI